MVSTIAVVESDTMLFSADSLGFIYVWNIDGYSLKGEETGSPERKCCKVSSLVYCTNCLEQIWSKNRLVFLTVVTIKCCVLT